MGLRQCEAVVSHGVSIANSRGLPGAVYEVHLTSLIAGMSLRDTSHHLKNSLWG